MGNESAACGGCLLFKGYKYGVLVDVIFRSSGEVYLDDEMVRRARAIDVRGIPAPSLAT